MYEVFCGIKSFFTYTRDNPTDELVRVRRDCPGAYHHRGHVDRDLARTAV